MSTMRFADEVVSRSDVDDVPTRRAKPDARTLKMATQLLDVLSADWDPRRYHDTYTEELRGRIKARDAGKEIVQETEERRPAANVVDLMSALEASVEAAKGTKRTRRRPAQKRSRKSA